MSATARIIAMLGMNPSDFNRGVDQAHSRVRGFEGALSGMKGKLAAAFSVGAVLAGATKIAQASGDIVDMAENLRITTDELQGLTLAAKEYGLSQDEVVGALQKVMRAQEDAASANPTKAIAEAMQMLGISLSELDSKNAAGIFEGIAKGAQGSATQMAAAYDILGKSGPRFRAFMEGVSQVGVEGVIAAARESGGLIGEAALVETDAAIDKGLVPLIDKGKAWVAKGLAAIAKFSNRVTGVSSGKAFLPGSGSDMSAANAAARQRAMDIKADEIAKENAEKLKELEFDKLSATEQRARLEEEIASNQAKLSGGELSKYDRAVLERANIDAERRLMGIRPEPAAQINVDQFRRIGANVFGGTTIDNTAKKSLNVQEKMLAEMKAIRELANRNKNGVF